MAVASRRARLRDLRSRSQAARHSTPKATSNVQSDRPALQLWELLPVLGACAVIGIASALAFALLRPESAAFIPAGILAAYLVARSVRASVDRAERERQHLEEKQQHIDELQLSQAQLSDLYLATIRSLALAIDSKDQWTYRHILRVRRYAVATAAAMGIRGPEMEGIQTGALLHDIGKLGVPEYVLLKPGPLTEDEFAKIKKHPQIGADILDPVEFPWPVLPMVKYHHERWDGSGYPEGLKGENIPLTARILAVADVYDALTSQRSYRNAWPHAQAMAYVRDGAGTHFDPLVVEAFLTVVDGVVEEMAAEGTGPTSDQPSPSRATSRQDRAARDIQHASTELWALYEVAQTVSSSLGLDETLNILSRKLAAIFPDTACLFMLKGDEIGVLGVRAAVGVNLEFFEGSCTWNTGTTSHTVLTTQDAYVGPYDPGDLLLTNSQTSQWVPLNSALIVPIVHQGAVLGTINLYSTESDAFGQSDRQLLETIAARAAVAIYNGLLFDRTQSQAYVDPLTGLHNLRYLTRYVDRRTSANAAGRFAVLCVDVDSFKPINENFGHQRGDEVLRDLAAMLRSQVGGNDLVTRYGGDEFLILLQGADSDTAESKAEAISRAAEAYDTGLVHDRLGPLHITVSVGMACYPGDGHDCASLVAAAESRMYATKTERKLARLAQRSEGEPPVSITDPCLLPARLIGPHLVGVPARRRVVRLQAADTSEIPACARKDPDSASQPLDSAVAVAARRVRKRGACEGEAATLQSALDLIDSSPPC